MNLNTADFTSLGLNAELTGKLKSLGILTPTRVQQEVIPAALEGRSLIVQSPTGTGKTLAYLIPLLMKADPAAKDLEGLVLVPSRELAMQVIRVLKELGGPLKVAALIGGASPARQLTALKEKPKFAVGTPGRVLELLRSRKINGQAVRTLVVDEADKMFTQGFFEDIKAILKGTLKTRQVVLCSATMPGQVLEAISSYAQDPLLVDIKEASATPETITHYYVMSDKMKRTQNLVRLIRFYHPEKAIVFIQRNEGVGSLTGRLQELGLSAAGLHSDLSQALRRDVLEKFRTGKVKLLVTTDLLARGMDIAGVDTIFNYDLPADEKHYLHRAGRTGRAGKPGAAVTLISEDRKFVLSKYEKGLGISFTQLGIDEDKVFVMKKELLKRYRCSKIL